MNGNNRKKITIFDDDDFRVDEYPYGNTNQNKKEESNKETKKNNKQDDENNQSKKSNIIYNDDGIPIGKEIDISVLSLLNKQNKKEKKKNIFDDYFSEEKEESIETKKQEITNNEEIRPNRINRNNNRSIFGKVKKVIAETFSKEQNKEELEEEKIKNFNERFFTEEEPSDLIRNLSTNHQSTRVTNLDLKKENVSKRQIDNPNKKNNLTREEILKENQNKKKDNQTLNKSRVINNINTIPKEDKNKYKKGSQTKSRVEQNKLKYEYVNASLKSRVIQNKDNYEKINADSNRKQTPSRVLKNIDNYNEYSINKNEEYKSKPIFSSLNNKTIPSNIIIKEPLKKVKKEEDIINKYKIKNKLISKENNINEQSINKNVTVKKQLNHPEEKKNIVVKAPIVDDSTQQEVTKNNITLKETLPKIKRGKISTFEIKDNKPVTIKEPEEVKKVQSENKITNSEIKNIDNNANKLINSTNRLVNSEPKKEEKQNNNLKRKDNIERKNIQYENIDIFDDYMDIDIPIPNKKEKRVKKIPKLNIDTKKVKDVLISIVLLVGSIIFIYNSIDIEQRPSVTYKEKTKTNYTVYLNDTRFYKEEKKYNNYLSQVVKLIRIDMNYKFDINKKSNLNFKYQVIGEVVVKDKEDKSKEIFKKAYVLSEERKEEIKKLKEYSINNSVSIDYKFYKEAAEEFSKTYDVETESYMKIYLAVDIKNNKKKHLDFGQKEKIIVQIPLSEKYVNINSEELNKEDIAIYKSTIKVKNIFFLLSGFTLFIINIVFIVCYKKKRI